MNGRSLPGFLASVVLALLAIGMISVPSIHASSPSWTVSLDANSTGPTDANVQSSHSIIGQTNVTVGAVVNASAAHPINNVRGWQFGIIYENTSLTPWLVQYGAQSGAGNPNWALLVASGGSAFASHSVIGVNATICGCDPATHAELIVYFTLTGASSTVHIGPVVSPTVKGNLLASVSFNVTNPSIVGARFTPTDIIFVDGNINPIPNILAGPSITETGVSPPTPPPPTPTNTIYILLGIVGAVLAGIVVFAILRRRRNVLEASSNKSSKVRSGH